MIEIQTQSNFDATISAPPSKAHTLRALFIAALADGRSTLKNALNAEDQQLSAAALREFGAEINFDGKNFSVRGTGGKFFAPKKEIYLGNSGAGIRFLMSLAGLAEGKTVINGSERMKQRPSTELISALQKLGVKIKQQNPKSYFPVEVTGKSFVGGPTSIEGSKSSQYISSILLSAPYAEKDVELKVIGAIKSRPYIDITLGCMDDFEVKVKNENYKGFYVKAGQKYMPKNYLIEGDYSNAAYFFAAAAVTGGKVKVTNLNKNSTQGDKKFTDVLKKMGCKVTPGGDYVVVEGPGKLKGISIDMEDMPDLVPTLAAVAAFAKGKTTIKNVGHLRIKESDRIKAVVAELKKLGVKALETKDGMVISGNAKNGAEIETYNDHRIAMAFSVIGLRQEGVKIKNPECVSKSFPDFYEKLGELE